MTRWSDDAERVDRIWRQAQRLAWPWGDDIPRTFIVEQLDRFQRHVEAEAECAAKDLW